MASIQYTLHDIDFEWDEQKAQSNLRKHGVSFETACEVFFDPFLYPLNVETVAGETREGVVGLTAELWLLQVVYTWREDAIRLVSARPATAQERASYEGE